MAVAHDASTESHGGTTGSVSEDSFTIAHTPVGTPKGVLIFVICMGTTTDLVGVVDYGGQPVPAVTSGRAVDTVGETMSVKAFFLGTGIPAGAQTVTINRTNNANVMWALCITVTAGGNTEYAGVAVEQESQALTEVSVDDGSPGADSVRYAGCASGLDTATQLAAGASSTGVGFIDFGATCFRAVRETTPGQGARSIGYNTSAATDDVAAVYLAIREIAAGGGFQAAWARGSNVLL